VVWLPFVGVDDGGSGQSKFKGKYSKLPASARRHGHSEDDEDELPLLWPASYPLLWDMLARPTLLLKQSHKMTTLAVWQQLHRSQLPASGCVSGCVLVFDDVDSLVPTAGSPYYRYWEQADALTFVTPVKHAARDTTTKEDGDGSDDEHDDGLDGEHGDGSEDESTHPDSTVDQPVEPVPLEDSPVTDAARLSRPAPWLCFGLGPASAAKHWSTGLQSRIELYLDQSSYPAMVGQLGLAFGKSCSEGERKLQVDCFVAQLQLAKTKGLAVLMSQQHAEDVFVAALRHVLPSDWPMVFVCSDQDPDFIFR
jgi:hypothetical protein